MNLRVSIKKDITCPNCWRSIDTASLLWVSSHPDLRGDPFLGEDALKRFLPSRFDVQGFAIDAKGQRCHLLACPFCHLTVPRILTEMKPIVVSTIGAPQSGKSYFLAATVWEMRKKLRFFQVNFTDADPVTNQIISGYEQQLFLSDSPGEMTVIKKTEEDGELYSPVDYGDRVEMYARPFVFSMQLTDEHIALRNGLEAKKNARALCMYDNAGEHFQPRQEAALGPATDHLSNAESLIFVFDPLGHPQFRRECRKVSSDPQLGELKEGAKLWRQDEILLEAAKRIRYKSNLASHEKIKKPLIVAVNKYDAWAKLLPQMNLGKIYPYERLKNGVIALNLSMIEEVSQLVRMFINQHAPEIVAACESFSELVTYVPLSPQGCSPELSGELLGIRPDNLKPIWAEVPLLYAIAINNSNLIATAKMRSVGKLEGSPCPPDSTATPGQLSTSSNGKEAE